MVLFTMEMIQVEKKYSQTSRKRTPLGPSTAVRLQEVSAYRRLKNTNTIGGRV